MAGATACFSDSAYVEELGELSTPLKQQGIQADSHVVDVQATAGMDRWPRRVLIDEDVQFNIFDNEADISGFCETVV